MEITNEHEKRFWNKVAIVEGEDCWLWLASKSTFGYGAFYIDKNNKSYGAHRVSWIMANGPIPDGLFVCHKCDNPDCVNPNHLFLGTQSDNMKDMVSKSEKMTCKTCNKSFGNSVCASCFDDYITCDCTTNVCPNCRKDFYDNPTDHRFGIALFALQECAPYANKKLSEHEEMAKERLVYLIKKVTRELSERV